MIVVTSSVLFGKGKPRPRAKVRGPVRGSCRLGTSFFTYTSHSSLIDKLLVDQGSPPPQTSQWPCRLACWATSSLAARYNPLVLVLHRPPVPAGWLHGPFPDARTVPRAT